ncbi:MAG: cytidine deaminase [Planctomycetia bacterium]|nr:cytidine deaminase [Planctomycetia bacterium]
MTRAQLLQAARKARTQAICTYSGFAVGAALLSRDGQVITGCNIENASYGLTVCAERVALWKALSEGITRFKRIVIVTESPVPTPPCGACRQLLWEFAGDIEVLLGDLQQVRESHQLRALFPTPFGARNLR